MIDWYQAGVLSDRYLETVLADTKNTLPLLAQAPLLALMAVAVWGDVDQVSSSLYFVMALSAFWLGCMSACREIVKERALFLRERMFNLNVGAYLYSKFRVLALLSIVQIACYALILEAWLDVRVAIGWSFLVLLAVSLCGTAFGLLISATARRSEHAVGIAPLVMLPQILLSEFAMGKGQVAGVSEHLYTLMPSRWGYEALVKLAQAEVDHASALESIPVLLVISAACLLLSCPLLARQRYD